MSGLDSRRLALSRETIRELTDAGLRAAGGIPPITQGEQFCYGPPFNSNLSCPTSACQPNTSWLQLSICECPGGITNASCYKTCTC
ncbi:MAG TPA: hypothetical protein VG245_02040 [Candidatus Dormibacteraeota bacterium]|jgi:hypothetical protein|nr:hypothetical protein [Candidatus Dormibacteraeota bacterium]